MDWVFHAALGFALPWRIAIAAALVAPLGILLGMPFPAGLRMIGVEAPALVPWAWGVNGFFTVIGSVLAMMLGMIFGFTTVLVVAGACYVACFLAIWMGHWHRPLGPCGREHFGPPVEAALMPSEESDIGRCGLACKLL